MPIEVPDTAFAQLMQWARQFSQRLPEEQQIEMRARMIQFLSQGVEPQAPPFSLADAADGRLNDDSSRVSPFLLLQIFGHYLGKGDTANMTLASEMFWQLIGIAQQQNSN